MADCGARNHNWFHRAVEPLDPVSLDLGKSLSALQADRVYFYYSVIKTTRLLRGSVTVAVPPEETDKSSLGAGEHIGAILLWLPPHHRASTSQLQLLYRSGFLGALWKYGPIGFYRIVGVFSANADELFAAKLPAYGVKASDCGYVQMIASNPAHAGRRYASSLLDRQMHLHWESFPGVPVVLDTSTVPAERAYIKLGFMVIGQKSVDSATDAMGIKLKKDAGNEVREESKKICVQKVLIRVCNS